jgi:hypothetical protein
VRRAVDSQTEIDPAHQELLEFVIREKIAGALGITETSRVGARLAEILQVGITNTTGDRL